MDAAEAKLSIQQIRGQIVSVRKVLFELDTRKGWVALGYKSFRACCLAEFPEIHERTVRFQLAAARVEEQLKELGNMLPNSPELTVREATLLADLSDQPELMAAAYTTATQLAEEENNGKLTDKLVKRAVDEVKSSAEPATATSAFTTAAPISEAWPPDQMKRKEIVEAGGTVVANMHKDADSQLIKWATEQNRLVRIDRKSEWGNPFEIPADGDRDTVCDSYEIFFPRKFSLHNKVALLKGKVLACWCYPNRCHGDFLVSAVKQVEDDA
jgi:hypothetical protein